MNKRNSVSACGGVYVNIYKHSVLYNGTINKHSVVYNGNFIYEGAYGTLFHHLSVSSCERRLWNALAQIHICVYIYVCPLQFNGIYFYVYIIFML